MVATLGDFIAELQRLANEYGDDIAVQTDEGDDPVAEYNEDDPEEPCVLIG